MSGFSADWLALREPVDHAARNPALLQAVAGHFVGRDHLAIIDLGSGAGSNLRGLAPALGASRQNWTLVDHDSRLLAAARARLTEWADAAEEQGEELLVEKAGKTIAVDFREADLNRDIERIADWRPDLVTAAALFDLVSQSWIERFVEALAKRRLPLYTALTYDGREEWAPPHALDARIHRAFLSHQRRDKGFGPSAGPDATDVMAAAFRRAGYQVRTGDSPWSLSAEQAPLTGELVEGVAAAAAETGEMSASEAREWARYRVRAAREAKAHGVVGHLDLWAAARE